MEQPRFMALPILWIYDKDSDEQTKERNELLGIESKKVKEIGSIYINPQHIVAYNMATDKNNCTLRLTDSDIYTIQLSLSEFVQKLNDFYKPKTLFQTK